MSVVAVDLQAFLAEKKKSIDSSLDSFLPKADQEPRRLHQAMRYAVLDGGKRFRPILAIAAFEMAGGRGEVILPAACALELVHTFSLVHDDLPSLDNDLLRRSQPSLHCAFDEATAILAGDALLALGFELLAQTGNAAVVAEVAQAIGSGGMIGGQMADLAAEGVRVSADLLEQIHFSKTGRLIRASLRVGALLADARSEKLAVVSCFGEKLGLAFQIADDILDAEGQTGVLGKTGYSDRRKKKATHPGVVGLAASKKRVQELIDEAKTIGRSAFPDSDALFLLADFVLHRAGQ